MLIQVKPGMSCILKWIPLHKGKILSFSIFSAALFSIFHFGPKIKSRCLKAGFAGATGTLTSEVLCHAIDTVNMRAKAEPIKIDRIISYFLKILKHDGPKSLMRGIPAVYYGYFPGFMLYYIVYEQLKPFFHKIPYCSSESISTFCAAAVSELVGITFVYPFDLIKTRWQVGGKNCQYKSLPSAIKTVAISGKDKIPSIKRLYNGFSYHLTTCVWFVALQFGLYEFGIHILVNKLKTHKKNYKCGTAIPTNGQILIASVFSGGIASILTNALETITVNKQIKENIGWRNCISWQCLKQGLGARIFYNCLLTGILFFALEHSYRRFGLRFTG